MVKISRIALLIIADAIAVNLSYIISYLLRFDFDVNTDSFQTFFAVYADNLFMLTIIKIAIFFIFGLYQSLWKYAGGEEIIKIGFAVFVATLAALAYLNIAHEYMPRIIYVLSCVFDVIFVCGIRFLYRIIRNLRNPGSLNSLVFRVGRLEIFGEDVTKVMVVGAGDAGASMIKEIKKHPEQGKRVMIAIDDDVSKKGSRIAGVKIVGTQKDIKTMARRHGIDEIIIAIPSAGKKEIQQIVNECNKTRCKLKILPALIDLINEKVSISTLRDVAIEDLLGRDPVEVNLREISGYIEGRIIMVTGGGGSIGSELCRQIAKFKPRRLVAVDIYENSIFELAGELRRKYPLLEFETIIGSVRSKSRMEEVIQKYTPHVIFHAAAHKHVPLMELNPKEAVVNNILGTMNMIDLADRYAVEKFVMISTDKAVNPTNVMGATKRAAEMILQEKSKTSNTHFAVVRFGNVLGSNGSVIPLFRKQIESGGPVTVTHEDITRYFMTIPEAVQLVIQAGAIVEGGEMFILDMGDPIKIKDLAENVVRLSGYTPYEDIDIVITRLRPGEKLHEELLLDEEGAVLTSHEKIYIGHPLPPSEELCKALNSEHGLENEVYESLMNMRDADVKEWLQKLVPSYMPLKKGEIRGVKIEEDE